MQVGAHAVVGNFNVNKKSSQISINRRTERKRHKNLEWFIRSISIFLLKRSQQHYQDLYQITLQYKQPFF